MNEDYYDPYDSAIYHHRRNTGYIVPTFVLPALTKRDKKRMMPLEILDYERRRNAALQAKSKA